MIRGRAIVPVWVIVGLVFSGLIWSAVPAAAPVAAGAPSRLGSAIGPPFGPSYSVTFTETGLPAGTSWAVTLNGSRVASTTNTVSFTEPNGTFNYTISNVPGWRVGSYSGSVTVNGGPAAVTVTWSKTAYSVTFTETGLPAGTLWSVTLSGLFLSSTGSSLSFVEPNGTYNYSVAGVPGWRASSYSGSLTVNGAAVSVTVTWTQTAYSVTFTESGLSPGTSWAVTLGGTRGSSSTNSIAFAEPNGTYSYNVSSILGWVATPAAGSVTVNGAPAAVTVTWTLVTYAVTFTETGLPSGTSWNVTLGGTFASSSTSSISFSESNGSYPYSVGLRAGYSIAPVASTLTVNGVAVAATIAFASVAGTTYAVTFTESGLPAGTPWGVTLGNAPAASTGVTLAFQEPNGALTYAIPNVPGWRANAYSGIVTVSGAAASVRVTWVELAYPVTFTEVGLPTGTSWAVSLGGVLVSSSSSSITFPEPNGTYGYSISNGAGWRANVYSGSVSVNGGPASVVVSWAQVVYPVTFTESGLLAGTAWTLTLNGTAVLSTNASIAFAEPNGTFTYTVSAIAGWHATPSAGSVVVNGRSVTTVVAWSPVGYAVTFTESGLPSGTSWSVTIGGSRGTSVNTSIAFAEPNGTYNYTVSNVPGWRASAYAGGLTVTAKPVGVALSWTQAAYSVAFTESGLPSGTSWGVTLGGVLNTATTSSITFPEPNGTYSYRISTLAGWRASYPTGSVTVAGGSASVVVTWTDVTYSVLFTESGLPARTPWTVALGSGSLTSNGTSITFPEPNGTFAYNLSSSSGWRAETATGWVTVSGGPASLTAAWAPVTYDVTFAESGLASATVWSVTLNGTLLSSNTSAVAFEVSNGTFAFTVSGISGWTPSPRTGSVTINGKAATVPVSWGKTAYPVTFTELGLTSGTYWGVTLAGTPGSSTTGSIMISEPNGTYAYTVAPLSGWHATAYSGSVTVSGKPVSVTVVWNEMTYPMTIAESGLPSGTTWTVTLNGGLVSSSTTVTVVQLPNGTFPYTVLGLPGWRASSYAGSATVSGQPSSVTLTWTQLTYAVSFTETGLPGGTSWSVTLSGILMTSTGATIRFSEPNGTFPYLVSLQSGWSTPNGTGSVVVSGWPAGVTVAWSERTYSVTFAESGLPNGAAWAVTVGGLLVSSVNRSTTFFEPNGTFGYEVGGIPGWRTTTYSGSVAVDGSPVVVTVSWARTTYPVTFTATGLPSGTSWSVTLSGSPSTSTGDSVTFLEFNGTFNYSVSSVSGWHASAYSGSVSVSGGGAGVTVAWSAVKYLVTFTETGLPAGTPWTVTIGATVVSSTNATLTIPELNGTYAYTVGSVGGYTLSPSSGSVAVSVNPVVQSITFRAASGNSSFLGTSGALGMAWIALAIAAVAAALVLLLLLLRARKGRPALGSWEAPAASEQEAPLSGETPVEESAPEPAPEATGPEEAGESEPSTEAPVSAPEDLSPEGAEPSPEDPNADPSFPPANAEGP